MAAGTSSEEYLNAFEHVLKKLNEFKPEFILISAGFDAHKADPLAQFNLETEDYFTITKRILETSKKFCNGKVVSILEGGYDLKALRESLDMDSMGEPTDMEKELGVMPSEEELAYLDDTIDEDHEAMSAVGLEENSDADLMKEIKLILD